MHTDTVSTRAWEAAIARNREDDFGSHKACDCLYGGRFFQKLSNLCAALWRLPRSTEALEGTRTALQSHFCIVFGNLRPTQAHTATQSNPHDDDSGSLEVVLCGIHMSSLCRGLLPVKLWKRPLYQSNHHMKTSFFFYNECWFKKRLWWSSGQLQYQESTSDQGNAQGSSHWKWPQKKVIFPLCLLAGFWGKPNQASTEHQYDYKEALEQVEEKCTDCFWIILQQQGFNRLSTEQERKKPSLPSA